MRKYSSITRFLIRGGVCLIVGSLPAALVGCAKDIRVFESLRVPATRPTAPRSDAGMGEQVELILPRKIKIEDFTKPASFDDDVIPDGLEVFLSLLDAFGDKTKAIGTFRFELYQFHKASADPRGKRLGLWEVDLTGLQAQAQHWERLSRMYRFRLQWTGEAPKPGKYALEVTYISPWGQRLSSTYIVEAAVPRGRVKERREQGRSAGGLF